MVGAGGVWVRVGREADGGVYGLDATVHARRTDTAQERVAGVEVVRTLTLTALWRRGEAGAVDEAEGTVKVAVGSEPVSSAVAVTVQVRAELSALLLTLTGPGAQLPEGPLGAGTAVPRDVVTDVARVTLAGGTAGLTPGARRTGELAGVSLIARSAGAVSGDGMTPGSVLTGADLLAAWPPPPSPTA